MNETNNKTKTEAKAARTLGLDELSKIQGGKKVTLSEESRNFIRMRKLLQAYDDILNG